MTEKIKLVRGDSKPQIKTVVKDDATGDPIDISGATATMLFRAAGSAVLQATLTGALLVGRENADGTITSTTPYDVPGYGGRVVFSWGPTDLDCDAGEYEGEIRIVFADTTRQTVYEPLKFKVREDFGA